MSWSISISSRTPRTLPRTFRLAISTKLYPGLQLILTKRHGSIANPELKERLDEIYQRVPSGYRLHIVTSGAGIPHEARVKLDAFADEIAGPTSSVFDWEAITLHNLQDRFYQQSIPAVDPLCFGSNTPYMVASGGAECYFFHAPGRILADLYGKHGEGLLQRNIRVDQRGTATNRSIEAACRTQDSANFLHFNNGVTFLCESAKFDPFKHELTLQKAQVGGGATLRTLRRVSSRGSLKSDVLVPVRAITSKGDKEFASNVAVNQNNQNQMGTGFLQFE